MQEEKFDIEAILSVGTVVVTDAATEATAAHPSRA